MNKIKRFNIYDCDGILLNSTHRFKEGADGNIDLEHWVANCTREMILKDVPDVLAEHYKQSLQNPGIFVIIATARGCELNDANYEVIFSKLGRPDLFVHRMTQTDTRGGADVKIHGIRPVLNMDIYKNVVVHVYEDNENYLAKMCREFVKTHKTVGHFNPSYQGC